jgi:hypothetical protein
MNKEQDQRTLQLLKKIIDRLKAVEQRTAATAKRTTDNRTAIDTLANNTQNIVSRLEKMINAPKKKPKGKWVGLKEGMFPDVWVVKTNKRKITIMASSESHAEVQAEEQLKSGERIVSIKSMKK